MGKSGPGTNGKLGVEDEHKRSNLKLSKSETPLLPLSNTAETGEGEQGNVSHSMPPATVTTRLIIIMVWRKLIRNPNTYGSIIGLVWSLISFRCNVVLPKIIDGSITILSNTGLGMAMFSLGLFMALQPKLKTCGKTMALFSMAVRFLVGPIVVASIAIGLRGDLLRVSILQVYTLRRLRTVNPKAVGINSSDALTSDCVRQLFLKGLFRLCLRRSMLAMQAFLAPRLSLE